MRTISSIELPPAHILLTRGQSFCKDARLLLKAKGKPTPIVVFHAPKSKDDEASAQLLVGQIFFEEVLASLQDFYELLNSFQDSTVLSVFLGRKDCFSQLSELALKCHLKFWDGIEGHLGFPEVKAGALPPTLIDNKSRTPSLLAPWGDTPIFEVKAALASHLLDSIMSREQLHDYLGSLSEENVAQLMERSRTLAAASPRYENGQVRLYSQTLLFQKTRAEASRAYFAKTENSLTANPFEWVTFDIGRALPPTTTLLHILQKGIRVVFSAPEIDSLCAGLETVQGRLQRSLSTQSFNHLWQAQVSWTISRHEKPPFPCFIWLNDEALEVRFKEQTLDVTIIGGAEAALSKELPICEVSHNEHFTQATTILRLAFNQIVKGPKVEGLSLTAFLRLSILIEIARLSQFCEGKILGVCDHLRRSGWSTVGNDIFWQRFIHSSGISGHALWNTLVEAGQPFQMEHWRELVLWCERKNRKPENHWPSLAISQHLALLVWHLVKHKILPRLEAQREPCDEQAFWHWAMAASGYPIAYGSPQQYALSWDRRRIDHTIRTYWSSDDLGFSRAPK